MMKGFVSRLTDRSKRNSVSLSPNVTQEKAPQPPALASPATASPTAPRPAPAPISYSSGPKSGPAQTKEEELAEKRKADEIARCSKLLRQMYTLDLRIWGMEAVDGVDAMERENLKLKANALFAEVHKMVRMWATMPQERWTAAEHVQIMEVHDVLKKYDRNRY
jgi:hypothetical protein